MMIEITVKTQASDKEIAYAVAFDAEAMGFSCPLKRAIHPDQRKLLIEEKVLQRKEVPKLSRKIADLITPKIMELLASADGGWPKTPERSKEGT